MEAGVSNVTGVVVLSTGKLDSVSLLVQAGLEKSFLARGRNKYKWNATFLNQQTVVGMINVSVKYQGSNFITLLVWAQKTLKTDLFKVSQ